MDDKSLVCISSLFFSHQALEGVYHILKLKLGRTSENIWLLSTYWGNAFQEYCDSILKNIFKTRYLTENEANLKYKNLNCDGLIITDKYIFILEVKSKRLTPGMMTYKSDEDFNIFLKEFIIEDGVLQVYKKAIKLAKYGLTNKREIIPVLITNESIPNDQYVRNYFNSLINEMKITVPNLLPYIFIDIRDIEILESQITKFRPLDIVDILIEYSRLHQNIESHPDKITTFSNFLSSRDFLIGHNILAEKIETYITELAKRRNIK